MTRRPAESNDSFSFRITDPSVFGEHLSPVAAGVTADHGPYGRCAAEHKTAFGELPSVNLRQHRYRLSDSKGL